jgi:hypothetical protein
MNVSNVNAGSQMGRLINQNQAKIRSETLQNQQRMESAKQRGGRAITAIMSVASGVGSVLNVTA